MEHTKEEVRVGYVPYGLGVFARGRFPAEDLIGPIAGNVVDDPNYESEYCMDLGGDLALEPRTPFRYLNHSCHPNCVLVCVALERRDGTPVGTELWVETLAEVAPGEQMTIDYAWPARVAIPCQCGCADCRGWIVAAEEQHKVGTR
jgi:uncharacterized protein